MKVLITGAGLGGLTTALRLAKKGYQVEIVEKSSQPGGRLNQLQKDGFTFDLGPTFFSMSYEFTEFVHSCNIEWPFRFIELDPLYTVNFRHIDKPYVIYKDLERLDAEFKQLEPDFYNKMQRFLKQAAAIFHDTEYRIIKKNVDSLLDFMGQMVKVPWYHAPKMFRSVWQELSRYFDAYEVKVIFSLVAFFLGATPFDTPAVYSMLTYTEMQHDGYYNVKGGMYEIVRGLIKELEKENVAVHCNTEIVDYRSENGSVSGFVDQAGHLWQADLYVANADAAAFRGKILNRKQYTEPKLDRMKWTLAPFTLYLGIEGEIHNLDHHNYFLGSNFKEYASRIFKNSISLDKPYYYVNVVSRLNSNAAPSGHEALFILCPVPDLRYKPDWSDREELADRIITDLSQRIQVDLKQRLKSKTVYDPVNWQNMFNLYKGSGLGLAHDMNQIGYFRPHNKDEVYSNLFYVGSSTIPGTGLPMAVISSKLVTERIENYSKSF